MAQPASYLGVDLSPDSIKLVELTTEKGKPKLVTYGYTEAKSDVLKGDFIANKNLTSILLKEVADRAKVTTNSCLAAIPTSQVFSSVIKLSGVLKRDLDNDSRLRNMLSEEVKKILPKPIEEMSFDYNILPTPEIEKAEDKTKLDSVRFLITAASKDQVTSYKEIFDQAGFQLINLDIESFSLINSLVGNDQSLIMLVDIGENRTNLSIVNLNIPILNRSIQIAGSDITKAIADSMKISVQEAENYKLDLGIMVDQENLDKFPRPIEQAISPIVSEIKYLLKTYYEQISNQKTIDKIILTGGSALLGNNLDKYLTNTLNIRTYIGDPWARIVYPEELTSVLQTIGPRFSVAVGLAMRQL